MHDSVLYETDPCTICGEPLDEITKFARHCKSCKNTFIVGVTGNVLFSCTDGTKPFAFAKAVRWQSTRGDFIDNMIIDEYLKAYGILYPEKPRSSEKAEPHEAQGTWVVYLGPNVSGAGVFLESEFNRMFDVDKGLCLTKRYSSRKEAYAALHTVQRQISRGLSNWLATGRER